MGFKRLGARLKVTLTLTLTPRSQFLVEGVTSSSQTLPIFKHVNPKPRMTVLARPSWTGPELVELSVK
jgi:hypothetical protein